MTDNETQPHVRFRAEIVKHIGTVPEHADHVERLGGPGYRYTTHAVVGPDETIWLGLGGDLDLGSVKVGDRQGCSRSVLAIRWDSEVVDLRQGCYVGVVQVAQNRPGMTLRAADTLAPWVGRRDRSTGRPHPDEFPGTTKKVRVDGSSVLVDLPDILTSVDLRWSPTSEDPTPRRRPETGTLTAIPRTKEYLSQRKDISILAGTIQFMIVQNVIDRNHLADGDGQYAAEILGAMDAQGFDLRQRGAKEWTAGSVIKKRSDVRKTLETDGYRSITHFALEKQLPFGTLDGLALAAQRWIDANPRV